MAITVHRISFSKRIMHAVRMIVDRLDLAADDPQRERQESQFGERSRFAWKLVVDELKEREIQPDWDMYCIIPNLGK